MAIDTAAAILLDMSDEEYEAETTYFRTTALHLEPYSFRVALAKNDKPCEFHYVKSRGSIHSIKPTKVWSYAGTRRQDPSSDSDDDEPRAAPVFVILEYNDDMPHVDASEIESGLATGIRTSASASTIYERVKSMIGLGTKKSRPELSMSTPLLTAKTPSLNKSYTDLPGSSQATLVRSASEAGTSATPAMHKVPIEHKFDAFLTNNEVEQAYTFFHRFMLYSQARWNRRRRRRESKTNRKAPRKIKSSGDLLNTSADGSTWCADAPPHTQGEERKTKRKTKARAKLREGKKKEEELPSLYENAFDPGAIVEVGDGAESADGAIAGRRSIRLDHTGRSSSFTS